MPEEKTDAEYLKNVAEKAVEELRDRLGPTAEIVLILSRNENNSWVFHMESIGGLVQITKLIIQGFEMAIFKLTGRNR